MYTNHPSKEQVRAYLAERGATRLPPPAPEEIRRRLDWHRCADPTLSHALFLPSLLCQLGACLALAWLVGALDARID